MRSSMARAGLAGPLRNCHNADASQGNNSANDTGMRLSMLIQSSSYAANVVEMELAAPPTLTLQLGAE